MRALFVGLGSIGTRHLQNLTAECARRGIPLEVTALRSAARTLPADTAALVHTEVEALPAGAWFDLGFITNPTNLHATSLAALQGRADVWFIEKPIFESCCHSPEALGLGPGQKAYVAAPMRWCKTYIALKNEIKQLKVYSARAICSSYLPDWRPGADYREIYSAKRDMGGGVTLDLIHEWDYLADLFGLPTACHNLRGRFSHLEIDSDDLSVYIARWPGMLGEVHLDYFGRGYRRSLELLCETGTLVADFGAGSLRLPDGSVQDCEEPVNARYEREMAYFLDYAATGGESVNSPAKALAVLKTTLGE